MKKSHAYTVMGEQVNELTPYPEMKSYCGYKARNTKTYICQYYKEKQWTTLMRLYKAFTRTYLSFHQILLLPHLGFLLSSTSSVLHSHWGPCKPIKNVQDC